MCLCGSAKELAPRVNRTPPQRDPLQPTPAPAEPAAVAGDATAHQPAASQNCHGLVQELFGGELRRVCFSNQDSQVRMVVARDQVQHPGID